MFDYIILVNLSKNHIIEKKFIYIFICEIFICNEKCQYKYCYSDT